MLLMSFDIIISHGSVVTRLRCGEIFNDSFITAARPAYAGTEGCYILRMFFLLFFIKRISVKTAKRCLAPYMAGRRA